MDELVREKKESKLRRCARRCRELWFLKNVLIFLGYAGFAYFGLKLAVPPGYATAIWIPSGIALGAALMFGLRSLPGVWLGSFVVNLYITHLNGGGFVSLGTWVVAALIGVGAVMQAVGGWYLIKRFISLKCTLNSPRDILLFSMLAGPVSCLINATWSNGVLFLFGVLPAHAIAASGLTWWIGDSIGVLIFTPVFLIMFGLPRSIWKPRIFQVLLPLLLSFAVVLGVYLLVASAEFNRVQAKFQQLSENKVREVTQWIDIAKHHSYSFVAYLSRNQEIEEKEFFHYAEGFLKRAKDVRSIEWAPYVSDKKSFESQYGFSIQEADIGKRVSASYLPVLYAYPAHGSQSILGVDLASSSLRNLLLIESKWKDILFLSRPEDLSPGKEISGGLLLLNPVYRNNSFKGYAVIVLNIQQEMSYLFGEDQSFSAVNLSFRNKGGPKNELYHFIKKGTLKGESHLLKHEELFGDEKSWSISVTSSELYLNKEYSWQVWSVLVGGLLFCVLMCIILFILNGQKNVIQTKVVEESAKLREEELKNALLLSSSGEGIFGVDSNGEITFINATASVILGYDGEFLVGKKIDFIFEEKQEADRVMLSVAENIGHRATEVKMLDCGKKPIWVEYTSRPINHKGQSSGVVVAFNDATKSRKVKVELEKLAHFDSITGLPNRNSFLVFLDKALARAKRNKKLMAVCFIDLDDFKQVNDRFGHHIGDDLLRMIPGLLEGELRDVDCFARLSGDEFALILENMVSPNDILDVLDRCLLKLSQPCVIQKNELRCSASIGVAMYPAAGVTAADLLKKADVAMYKSKGLGKNRYSFYNEETNKEIEETHEMEKALKQAFEKKEFSLLYQPMFDAQTEKVFGVEVLSRWKHKGEQVSPIKFIPVMENMNLVNDLTLWLLNEVGKDYTDLTKVFGEISISINASIKDIENTTFLGEALSVFSKYKMDPNIFSFEVAELSLMKDPSKIMQQSICLKEAGIKLSLDDFGIGHSSWVYLKKLPIFSFKIAPGFIQGLSSGSDSKALVKAIIAVAESMGKKTIAKGVETKEQYEFLKEQGCSYLQGYYFSEPISKDMCLKKYVGGCGEE